MSAFIVSRDHINAMINAAYSAATHNQLSWRAGPDGAWSRLTNDNLDAVGQMLADENAASVAHRYDEPPEPVAYHHTFAQPRPPVEILKALDCYEYQSCEHPGWPESSAFAFCASLRSRMINRLPGYEAAPWGI